MEKTEKKAGPRKLFLQRMKREGREKDWFATLKRVMAETGKQFTPASWVAMREMGYVDAATERKLLSDYEANLHHTALRNQIKKEQDIIREERVIEDFEDAVRMLPDDAPDSVVRDWIAGHPAMARLSRQKDKTKAVMITASDLLQAPHGKAPSKSAAHALQHWANCPHEFWKEMLRRKTVDDVASVEAEAADTTIGDAKRLLAEVASRNSERTP